MAAFIIAVRGTITQAVILGLSAAISHSLLIWFIAGVGLYYGNQLNIETYEPYFQLVSAFIIAGMALWMLWRTRKDIQASQSHSDGSHSHSHDHPHDHAHDEEAVVLNTGHGTIKVSIFEEGIPPVFRINFYNHGKIVRHNPNELRLETIRPDGSRHLFAFAAEGDCLQSTTSIPEPHEFKVNLRVSHGNHSHCYPCEFHEHHHHGTEAAGEEFQDAHERAHATEIETRFAGRQVTTGQIILFGIAGGLMPCPAAVTVLIICLQLKQFALGFSMVAAFSFGLALTMVASGVLAAWSLQHAQKRFKGFGELMRKAPYISVIILLVLATYIGLQAVHALALLPR